MDRRRGFEELTRSAHLIPKNPDQDGPPWRSFSQPMAAVEVCVVAWLAWGVVAGLLGVVWGGSGAVSG